MKKTLSLILCISMIISSAVCVRAEESTEDKAVDVIFDKEYFYCRPLARIRDDCVIVPARCIFEAMGAEVKWIDDEKTVIAEKGTTSIQLNIGSPKMIKRTVEVDGEGVETEVIELDVYPQIIDDRTFVPLRAVSDVFGYGVLWNDFYKNVYILGRVELDDADISELVKYNIISEEDLDKDTYITNLEALKTINNVVNGGAVEKNLRYWYEGEVLKNRDYLDEEIKGMLFALCRDGRNDIIYYSEIVDMDIDENMTEYRALVYLTRMVGDTTTCTDVSIESFFTEKSETYIQAFYKGLIDSADMSNADKPIEREYFYTLLDRALHIEYTRGGYGGAMPHVYIDDIAKRGTALNSPSPIPTATPLPPEPKQINVDTVINDDMSVQWELPEEYDYGNNFIYATLYWIYESGKTIKTSKRISKEIQTNEFLKMIASSYDDPLETVRCKYEHGDDTVCFDINIPDIKTVLLKDEIKPGIYMRYKYLPANNYITLADGEMFKKDVLYMLTVYSHEYRKEEYNSIVREVFKSNTDTDKYLISSFYSNKNDGFFSDIHIQEISFAGNPQDGFTVYVTPESSTVFEIVKEDA